jgi:hypothetical protein
MGGGETAAISGVFALIGGFVGSWAELRKLNKERMIEREEKFEYAQTGYSECYRKFLRRMRRYQANPDSVAVSKLLDNFNEARFAGDPIVGKELKEYWPDSTRSAEKAPPTPAAKLGSGDGSALQPLASGALEDQETLLTPGCRGSETQPDLRPRALVGG